MFGSNKNKDLRKKNKDLKQTYGKLIDGLPMAENTFFLIDMLDNGLKFNNNGHEFHVSLEKITSIDCKSETEVENIIKSSATGMIIGGTAFGLLGAMVLGRPKNKRKKNVSYFMIVNYESDNELKHVIFDVTNSLGVKKVLDYYNELKGSQDIKSFEL